MRILRSVALAACASATLVLSLPTAAVGDVAPARQPRVFVVGDSLTYGLTVAGDERGVTGRWSSSTGSRSMAARLGSAGFRLVPHGWNSRVARRTDEGIEILRARRGSLGDIVVVALSTNDTRLSSAQYARRIDAAMRVIGPSRRVIWVNAYLPTMNDRRVDSAILAALGRFPSLVVHDWRAFMTATEARRQALGLRSLTSGDHVHLTDRGDEIRRLELVAVLRACGPIPLPVGCRSRVFTGLAPSTPTH